MKPFLSSAFKITLLSGFLGALIAISFAIILVRGYGRNLPDHAVLAKYTPQITTRVHAGDGRILAEFKREHRLFVPIGEIPDIVRVAFLSAEDKDFYTHPGIDVQALTRAVFLNLKYLATGRRLVGGSTITQQVAKNFLLTNEVSYERKIKEAILAFRIERALTKEQIFELYLNEIYLGEGTYGVAAAAMTYFGKSLTDLSIEEAAYLAALPKAPSNYHPIRQHAAAVGRRNWVIGRMAEDGWISQTEAESSSASSLTITGRPKQERVIASWFSEEVRRELKNLYGETSLYGGGMSVRATIDPKLQHIADTALADGLETYDRRHGWRGAISTLPLDDNWFDSLKKYKPPLGILDRQIAAVIRTTPKVAYIGLQDGTYGSIHFEDLKWARKRLKRQRIGPSPKSVSDVLSPGDVVTVRELPNIQEDIPDLPRRYSLDQIPNIDGALVAIDPHTGRVLAMSGGYSADRSQFNRVTQANRQPGSAIKPFIYLSALEAGHTPATLILDAPVVVNIPGYGLWKPQNYSGKIYGPSPMRIGLEKSRNLMTIRLAEYIGIDKIISTADRFGLGQRMRPELGSALGSGEVTLLELTSAYAMIANGGLKISPSFIDTVHDRNGNLIFRHDNRKCQECIGPNADPLMPPELPNERERVADPLYRYQLVSMMQGVVENGTGRRVRLPGRPLAGKTGTTNKSLDAWFVGFSSNLTVGVFVGFDQPRTLGPREGGGSVAAPIFGRFMREAWPILPGAPFKTPPGLEFVRVNRLNGLPAKQGDKNTVLEAFLPGTIPSANDNVIGAGLNENLGEMIPSILFDEDGDDEVREQDISVQDRTN